MMRRDLRVTFTFIGEGSTSSEDREDLRLFSELILDYIKEIGYAKSRIFKNPGVNPVIEVIRDIR